MGYFNDGVSYISTHTLRKEGDKRGDAMFLALAKFQPTPSARRVTWARAIEATYSDNFNPHPPQGG